MSKVDQDFSALVGSRICHDLISPIGAINNGLELLGMSSGEHGPEIELIGDSVGNATARIKMYRIAFGDASDQAVGRAEIVSILDDYCKGTRLSMQWGVLDPQPRSNVRLAFLALLCFETALPYGGDIRVDLDADRWSVQCSNENLNSHDPVWSWLSTRKREDLPKLKPAEVQFGMLPSHAIDCDRLIMVLHNDQGTTITF